MPTSAPRACDTPGCKEYALPGTWKCATHTTESQQHKADNDRYRADDPVRKLYAKSAYKNQFQPTVIRLNPQCQRLLENWGTGNGRLEQCHNPSSEVHHFISPRQRPDLFMDYSNVAAVCKNCHHKHQGEPDKTRYVPTKAFNGPAGYGR